MKKAHNTLLRLSPEQHRDITSAAHLKGVSVNFFVSKSAHRAALRVLEEHKGRCPACGRKG